jgi:alkylated DNA repair protein (DNA oxidative demethylase)
MRALKSAPSREPSPPPGFLYVPDVISPSEERSLLAWFSASPDWNQITFRGQTARRQAMSFGARYLTQGRRLLPAPPLPPELAVYRDRMVEAACTGLGRKLALAGRSPADFALCTALRYPPGGAIRWHADNPAFAPTVMSLSLGAEARLELRPTRPSDIPARFDVTLAPRSLFVLGGEVRSDWQHRILPVREERYSFTVRARRE